MRWLIQDILVGSRNLLALPRFTVLVVLTLALGIGAAATIFSLVDAVLLRSLKLAEPERLTMLWPANRVQDVSEGVTSYPSSLDWREGDGAYESMAAYGVPRELLREQRGALWLLVVGRLASEYPETHPDSGVRVVPLPVYRMGDVRRSLLILFGAVGVLLLIACINVANLLLARATLQVRDYAIRTSLGASRGQIARQLLVESVLLSLAGCAGGLVVALWGVQGISSMSLEALPGIQAIGVDGRVLLFTLGVSLATALVFGLFPAVQASRPDFSALMPGGGRGSAGGVKRGRLRRFLVVGEVALALVLLVGAGLLAESFQRLRAVDPGFDDESSLETVLEEPVAKVRLSAGVLALLAPIALILAVVGLYATESYLVSQNASEIAIRMALGASRRQTVRRVVAQGTLLALVGIAIGLVAALVAARWLGSLLLGVSPTDPGTFAGASLLLLSVALAASYLPARRAAATDPARTLREG